MTKKAEAKNIGIEVKAPKESCDDARCPFHGNLNVKKRMIKGILVSKDLHKSATIENERIYKIRKYERYLHKKTKIRVHNPPCINAEIGDKVKAIECRPISKTKNFVIIEKIGHDIFVEQKIKDEEEAKKSKTEEMEAKAE